MGKPSNSSGNDRGNDVFDVQRVRQLVELMNEHNLAEVDLRNGDQRIQLRGTVAPTYATMQIPVHSPITSPVVQPIASSVSHVASPQPPADDTSMVFIKSPMVGTFYAAPKPDAPPFVKVGDTVGQDTTVCILEAMKVYNEIQAECSGKVVAVLVKNGEPVDFGKPLFKIDPRG